MHCYNWLFPRMFPRIFSSIVERATKIERELDGRAKAEGRGVGGGGGGGDLKKFICFARPTAPNLLACSFVIFLYVGK